MALPCNTFPINVFSNWNFCLVKLSSRVLTVKPREVISSGYELFGLFVDLAFAD